MGFCRGSRGGCSRWVRGAAFAAIAACAAYGVAPRAQAQSKTMLVEPPAPLLPATLGKLERVSEGDVGDGLGKVDPNDAAVLKEDGLRRFAQSDYAQGAERGSIAVYRFADVSGAISAFDYFRKPGMRAEKLGDVSAAKGDELLVRSGVNVVREDFKAGTATTAALTNELIGHLPSATGPAAMAPLLPTLLPAKGLDPDSVKYALGPAGYAAMGGVLPVQAIGFNRSAETVTARAKTGGLLTVVEYPTPEIAGEQGRAIEGAAQAGVIVKLRRDGPVLAIASGAWPSPADAQSMVNSIHLRSEVTMDKPMPLEFHAEVKKTYSLLVSIAIFCGFSALAMLVLGLSLGGGRALVRVMQGKPAATEPEFLHIDLREAGHTRLGDPKA